MPLWNKSLQFSYATGYVYKTSTHLWEEFLTEQGTIRWGELIFRISEEYKKLSQGSRDDQSSMHKSRELQELSTNIEFRRF